MATPEDRAEQAVQRELGQSLEGLPPPTQHVDVAIVGGGLGGLALAVGLQHRGIAAHVFEAAPALRTDSGTIFGSTDHAFAALDGIKPGLARAVQSTGRKKTSIKMMIRDGFHQPPTVSITPPFSGTSYTVQWQGAQQVLAAMVDPSRVHCGHRFVAYKAAESIAHVEAVFATTQKGTPTNSQGESGTGNGSLAGAVPGAGSHVLSSECENKDLGQNRIHGEGGTQGEVGSQSGEKMVACNEGVAVVVVRAQLVVGADGVRSAVRRVMVGDTPRYLRCINWNALVPYPEGRAFECLKEHQSLYCQDRAAGLGWIVVDAGHGFCFWQLRIFDEEQQLTLALKDSTFGGFGQSGAKQRVLTMLSHKLCNSKQGGADNVAHGALNNDGVSWLWAELKGVIEATDESYIFERFIMDRLPLARWSALNGRVVLLGDAAHAMFPGPGQGAQMAFEDAHQLCLALDGALSSSNSNNTSLLFAAIQRYETQRILRTTRVQRFAAELSALPADETQTKEVQALSQEQKKRRFREFVAWLDKYPDCVTRDPESEFWK